MTKLLITQVAGGLKNVKSQSENLEQPSQDGPIPSGRITLHGELIIPPKARGMVLFAHGSGSSRHSPRNQLVARMLRQAGLGTLLFDLLTLEEEELDMKTRHLRFDIDFLASRLIDATNWVHSRPETQRLRIGYFGCSTGAAAALSAATRLADKISAVVSRGGRPDLAGHALNNVKAATLLIVGQEDASVVGLNEQAMTKLRCAKELRIIPHATHLFEEAGALEEVSRLAAAWFDRYFQR